jgi:soluble lytic murein transglycosylase-like protein
MHSSIVGRRARDRGLVTMAVLIAACASSGDTVPPVPTPEPIAAAASELARPVSRAAKPAVASHATVPARAAIPAPAPMGSPRRPSAQPDRAPQPARAVKARPSAKVRMDSAAMERAVTKQFAYQPLSVALAKRTRATKTELADRIAAAVVYEAERNRLSPSLLAAVLLIENAPFDTTAISSQGAVGLMQVMPVHIGSYGCPSQDLHSVEANICHGARILHMYIRRAKGEVPLALKRYNGCVRGRNTPRCYRYPTRVLRVASKLRHEMLVSAAGLDGGQTDDVAVEDAPMPAVTVPSQPSVEPDTSITTTTTQASECTTFMGCLKHRWTQR